MPATAMSRSRVGGGHRRARAAAITTPLGGEGDPRLLGARVPCRRGENEVEDRIVGDVRHADSGSQETSRCPASPVACCRRRGHGSSGSTAASPPPSSRGPDTRPHRKPSLVGAPPRTPAGRRPVSAEDPRGGRSRGRAPEGPRSWSRSPRGQVNAPWADSVPTALQVAVPPASTFATAATPSPTPLPAASTNLTWTTWVLALPLLFLIWPAATGWPPAGSAVQEVTVTSLAVEVPAAEQPPNRAGTARRQPLRRVLGLIRLLPAQRLPGQTWWTNRRECRWS